MNGKLAGLAVTLLAMLILATAALAVQAANAQSYPPPVGSLSVSSSTTTPSTGSTTTLTATVLDSAGKPVAGATVTFRIASQPGGARFANNLTETTAVTATNGVAQAVLSVGTTPGQIIVQTVSGEKTSQITLQVQSPAGVPSTGGAPAEGGDSGVPLWQIALVASTVVLLAGAILIVGRRRKA